MTPPSTARRRRCAVGAGVLALVAPLAVSAPAWASDVANEIVYTADEDNDGNYSLVLRNLETRQSTTVLPEDDANGWIYDDPELSPDGQLIAFSTDRGNGGACLDSIAVVSRTGTGLRNVTTPPAPATSGGCTSDTSVAWSPDGSRLLFTRYVTEETSDGVFSVADTSVLTVPAGGGTPTPLAGAESGATADWSPDGRSVVFADLSAAAADVGELVVVGADGSGRRSLGASGLMPAWSPDGSTIAYATVTVRGSGVPAEDTTQIATVPATGGTPRILGPTRPDPARATVAEYPAWTPDGQGIVYDLYGYAADDSFPPGDLWAVDRDGVRAGRILSTPGDEAQPHLQGPRPANVAAGAASTYVPVSPVRVLDTRPAPNNVGTRVGKVAAGGFVDLPVHGASTPDGAVPSAATAVVLNVTAANVTANTDVRVYPTPGDGAVPRVSNLNVAPGQVVPNLVTTTIGSNGSVRLRNSAGSVDLIADIAGYYVPSGGLGFTAVDPGRVLDTRPAPNNVGAPAGKVGAAGVLEIAATGSLRTVDGRTVTVPADAEAVVLNVTATGATADTNVRVYPAPAGGGSGFPTVSNLNLRPGQTVANLVTVAVGEGGEVRLRNANGSVHLIADVAGYYSSGSTGRFVPVAPLRFLDTRSGVGAAPIATTAGGYVDLGVAGRRGVPAGATAAVLNVTATGVTAATDVRAYPSTSAALPTVSNLNLGGGQTRANLAVVKVGTDGEVRVRNAAGEVQLIADIAGYMVG